MADDTLAELRRERKNSRAKAHYLANREKRCAANQKWYAANRDKIKAAARAKPAKTRSPETIEKDRLRMIAWRSANRDKVRAANQAHYAPKRAARKAARDERPIPTAEERAAALAARRASQKASKAKRRMENPEPARAVAAAWRLANPGKVRAANHARRVRILGVSGKHTANDILDLLAMQGKKCAHSFCRASIKGGYHVDHIMPLARGGSNDRKNLQLLCAPCNHRKHAKHPVDFALENGMLV